MRRVSRGAGNPATQLRRSLRWTAAVAVTAALPKCFVCVAAYAGLVAGAGRLGPELCGEASTSGEMTGLGLAGLLAGVGVLVVRHEMEKRRIRAAVSGMPAADRRDG